MIRFDDVSFRYATTGGRSAEAGVEGIDFEVAPGECVLVCGASGSGKTTVARLANGLAPGFLPGELTGRVSVDGHDLSESESWERARLIGSVFQNPRTQFFNTDVAGEVAFTMECLAWPEDRLRVRTSEALAGLGLSSMADRSIFSLSGGERQRVAFASAYASSPANYVLDEPTSNLDARATAVLADYLRIVKQEGGSILVTEHRLHWLAGCVDRVVWLTEGRIGRVFTRDEFWALGPVERAAMGLRCVDPAEVTWQAGGQPSTAPRPELEAESLSATHRGREVVRGVGFAAHAGEVIAITGLNGAGKSTLSRLMCGLHRPGRGILRWEGRMLARGDRLRLSAMVFQDVNYQLFADSVAAEVGFGLGTTDSGVVAGLLEELDLGELAERHPATLSGGQKQRLAVAASIAAGKRILVFDEPTSGLDLIGMTRVADLVRRVAANGSVVFVATHDLEFICRSCTRVLHLADGGITDDVPLGPDDVPRIAGLLGGRVSGWSAAGTERCGVSGPDRTALT